MPITNGALLNGIAIIENGADVHARDDYALRWSAKYGHLDAMLETKNYIIYEAFHK